MADDARAMVDVAASPARHSALPRARAARGSMSWPIAAVIAASVGTFALVRRGPETHATQATATVTSAPDRPSKVSIRLTVTPPDADLILDGMRVGSAGDALVLPRSTQSRPLRVEKPGFEAQAIWVLPDRDQELPPIALRPAPVMVPVPTAVPVRTPVRAAPHGDIEKPDYLKK